MKQILFGLLALILGVALLPAVALAQTGSSPSAGLSGFLRQSDVVGDTLVKTGPGLLHTVVCASDAAATAGTLAIRDGVAAGGGTLMQQIEFVVAYFPPNTMLFDYPFTTGLFLDFTTTADVHCSVSYR